MFYRFRITIWCFLLSFNLSIPAQQVNTPHNRWLLRAEALTGEIVGDATLLSKFDRALMYARLAEIWWKSDQLRARTWMQKAIVEVESAPEQEDAQEPGKPPMRGRSSFEQGLCKLLAQHRIESTGDVQEIEVSGNLAY